MNQEIPFDEEGDGDALRKLRANGSDLSKPMEIDFAVDVFSKETGHVFAKVVEPLGFCTKLIQDSDTQKWTCYCSRTMVPMMRL